MTTKECKENSGKCYVLLSEDYNDILMRKDNDDFTLYPERHMTLRTLANKFLPPSGIDVVTENPWIICSYDYRNVYVLNKKGKWEHPDTQTFGCSVEIIMDNILGVESSISRLPSEMLSELLGR
jgi:hypothetical protein